MLRLLLCRDGWSRAEYLKKHGVFHSIGKKCYYHPYRLPAECHLVSMGDNVFVGTGVSFVTHNMANCIFNNMDNEKKIRPIIGKIEVGNNVFIGANSTIMYNVKIGDNVKIGVNSVVTRSVPDGVVVAGVPAKQIGTFDSQLEKFINFNMMHSGNLETWEKQHNFFWKK